MVPSVAERNRGSALAHVRTLIKESENAGKTKKQKQYRVRHLTNGFPLQVHGVAQSLKQKRASLHKQYRSRV